MKRFIPNRRVAGNLAGLAILTALLVIYDPRAVYAQLQNVRWSIAAPAILGLTLVHFLQIETWRELSARMAGITLPRRHAAMTYYAGQAVGVVTPANLGADFYRAFSLKSTSGTWDGVVAPIIGQRAISALALVVLAGFGLVISASWKASAAVLIPVLGLLALAAITTIQRGRPLLAAIVAKLPDRMRVLTTQRLGALGLPFLLASLFHAGSVLLAYLLVLSVHPAAPLFATIRLLLISRLTTLVPITPYGLGFQEASLALLLPTVGLDRGAALAVSVLNRLAMLVTAGVGIATIVASKHKRRAAHALETTREFGPA